MKYIIIYILLLFIMACDNTGKDMKDKDIEKIQKRIIAQLKSGEFKQSVGKEKKRMEAEYNIKEEADWFGKTGMDEETERELPHYIRRELGESLYEEDSLMANDLEYMGSFPLTSGGNTHFWRISWKDKNMYATVEIDIEGNTIMSWGSKRPPEKSRD